MYLVVKGSCSVSSVSTTAYSISSSINIKRKREVSLSAHRMLLTAALSGWLRNAFLIISLKCSVLIWSVMSWLCAFVLRHKKACFSFLCTTEIKILGNRPRLRKTRHYDLVLYCHLASVIYSRLYILLFFSYNVVNSTVLYLCNKNPDRILVFIHRWINDQCWILFRICDYLHYCNIVSTY